MLESALQYARQGIRVFPLHTPRRLVDEANGEVQVSCSCGRPGCGSVGKHPRTPNGVLDATTDEQQICEWWRRWPDANIGGATGQGSGIVVADCDGARGRDAIKAYAMAYGGVPATQIAHTGGGGWHLVFRSERELRNRTGVLPGVDFRGDGGYVVLPPSSHASGNEYHWLTDGPPAPMPAWLVELVATRPSTNGSSHELGVDTEAILRGVPKGERDTSLFKLACSLRAKDLPYAEAQRLVLNAAARCVPPFAERDAIRKLDQAWKYPPQKRVRVWFGSKIPDFITALPEDDVLPFPMEALPGPVRDIVEESAIAIGCPPDFIAVSALVALGVAIGATRELLVKPGWLEGTTLFCAIVADPGSKKSPALDQAVVAFNRRQRQAHSTYLIDKSEYDSKKRLFDVEVAAWEASYKEAKKRRLPTDQAPEEPKPPVLPSYFTTNTTIEALADMLNENRRGVLVVHDELTSWVRSMNMYRAGRGDDRQQWLKLWSRSSIRINRKGQEPIYLPYPFAAVVGCLPPDVLNDLRDEQGREDGFIHRILFCLPDRTRSGWNREGIRPETIDTYCHLFNRIWSILQMGQDSNGSDEPVRVKFTQDGLEWWEEWHRDHDAELDSTDFPLNLRGPWSKLEAYSLRLSLIIQETRFACGEAETEDVDADSVCMAGDLIDYFKSHTRRVYRFLTTTADDKKVMAVYDWIRKQGPGDVLARAVLRNNVAGVQKSSEVEKILKDLQDRRLGSIVKVGKARAFRLGLPDNDTE